MGNFNEKQIFLATLDEYNFHKKSKDVEHICIYLDIALIYKDNDMDNHEIIAKLKNLLTKEMQEKICRELGDEYENFCCVLNSLMGVDAL